MGELGENDRGQNVRPARAPAVLVPAVRSMQAQCRTKFCQKGEKIIVVPPLHEPISVPSADLVLRKNTGPHLDPCSEEVDSAIKPTKENGWWSWIEWATGVTEPFIDVQDPFRITDFARAPYPLRDQTGWGLIHQATHMRPVV